MSISWLPQPFSQATLLVLSIIIGEFKKEQFQSRKIKRTPQGTLWAIIVTWISYGFFAFQVTRLEVENVFHLILCLYVFHIQTGFVFNNRASGISEEFRFFNNRSVFRCLSLVNLVLVDCVTYFQKWHRTVDERSFLERDPKRNPTLSCKTVH